MKRWLKFNAVGMAGAVVQLSLLAMFTQLGLHYLIATALAVEIAVLHNYFWHVRWTWKDRRGSLWRFNFTNGLASLILNVACTRLCVRLFGMPPVSANLIAILVTSFANF